MQVKGTLSLYIISSSYMSDIPYTDNDPKQTAALVCESVVYLQCHSQPWDPDTNHLM